MVSSQAVRTNGDQLSNTGGVSQKSKEGRLSSAEGANQFGSGSPQSGNLLFDALNSPFSKTLSRRLKGVFTLVQVMGGIYPQTPPPKTPTKHPHQTPSLYEFLTGHQDSILCAL
jgi:hypothetical protein